MAYIESMTNPNTIIYGKSS